MESTLTEVDWKEKVRFLLAALEKLSYFKESEGLRFDRNDKEFRIWFHCCDDPALIGPNAVGYLAELLQKYDERDAQSIFCSRVSSSSYHSKRSEEVEILRTQNYKLNQFSNWQDSGWPIEFFPEFFLALNLERPSLDTREYCQYFSDEKNSNTCAWCGLNFKLKNGLCDVCEDFWEKA